MLYYELLSRKGHRSRPTVALESFENGFADSYKSTQREGNFSHAFNATRAPLQSDMYSPKSKNIARTHYAASSPSPSRFPTA